jgi:heat-inducible transcriptional repressor
MPSPLAYKFYVENFLPKRELMVTDIAKIDNSFNKKFVEIQDIVKTAARVISDVTNYTSVIVLASESDTVVIKNVKLVKLDEQTALIIIVTDSGIIRDKVITVNNPDESFIAEANMLINKVFKDKTVQDLKHIDYALDEQMQAFKELIDNVMQIILSHGGGLDDTVILEGESKLLDYPEANMESAKNFLSVIDDKSSLVGLIENSGEIEFSVKIGKDETHGMDRCAIVSAQYKVKGKVIGHAGVIGPERMDYNKVMSVLSYVGDTLDTLIK